MYKSRPSPFNTLMVTGQFSLIQTWAKRDGNNLISPSAEVNLVIVPQQNYNRF